MLSLPASWDPNDNDLHKKKNGWVIYKKLSNRFQKEHVVEFRCSDGNKNGTWTKASSFVDKNVQLVFIQFFMHSKVKESNATLQHMRSLTYTDDLNRQILDWLCGKRSTTRVIKDVKRSASVLHTLSFTSEEPPPYGPHSAASNSCF